MGNLILKPATGGDLILQEDGGSAALTIDTSGNTEIAQNIEQADGKNIQTDEIRARDGDGLKLYDDGGNGIFIKDGGKVGIGGTPSDNLHIQQAKSGSGAESYDLLRFNLTGTGAIGDSSNIVWHSTSGTQTAGILGISGGDNIAYGSIGFRVRKFTTDSYDEAMRLNNRGYLGIGTTGPSHILHITAQGRSTSSTWATSSDGRVKENIVPHEESLKLINQLKPKRFNFKSAYRPDAPKSETGFIAQDFESVFPEAVTTIEREEWITEPAVLNDQGEIIKEEVKDGLDDFKILNTSCLLPMLVKAVQELSAKVTALENA